MSRASPNAREWFASLNEVIGADQTVKVKTVFGGGIAGRSPARSACSERAGPSHSIKGCCCDCPQSAEIIVGTAASQFAECPWQFKAFQPMTRLVLCSLAG